MQCSASGFPPEVLMPLDPSLRQLAEGVKPRGITLWDRRRALVPLRSVLLIPLSPSAKPLLSSVHRRKLTFSFIPF